MKKVEPLARAGVSASTATASGILINGADQSVPGRRDRAVRSASLSKNKAATIARQSHSAATVLAKQATVLLAAGSNPETTARDARSQAPEHDE